MSTNKKKAAPKLSRIQELQKKYPGRKPIPPSTRTVVIVLAATVILSLLLVFAFLKKPPAPQALGNKYVTLETSMGTIKLELDGDKAPRTVTQFLENVTGGKYDGLTFHRIMKGFMIQGGDPNGNGTGGKEIPFEKTDISHVRGCHLHGSVTGWRHAVGHAVLYHAGRRNLSGWSICCVRQGHRWYGRRRQACQRAGRREFQHARRNVGPSQENHHHPGDRSRQLGVSHGRKEQGCPYGDIQGHDDTRVVRRSGAQDRRAVHGSGQCRQV